MQSHLLNPRIEFNSEINVNDYHVDFTQCLGSGAQGCVYQGTYREEKVAIKISAFENNAALREMNIIGMINTIINWQPSSDLRGSECITRYYGYGEHSLGHALIYEYANIGSLDTFIFKVKENPLGTLYPIMLDIAQALKFLHHYKIVHCDIKSQNILLFSQNNNRITAKLCDFGLSKINDQTIEYRGAYMYSAPEILFKLAPLSNKSDMYSFAIVLWEMLARKPITSEYLYQHGIHHLQQLLQHLFNGKRVTLYPSFPSKIAHLITWGWDTNPRNRMSAKKCVEELESSVDTISERLINHGMVALASNENKFSKD